MSAKLSELLKTFDWKPLGQILKVNPDAIARRFELRRFDDFRVVDLKEAIRFLRAAFKATRNPYLRLNGPRKQNLVTSLLAALDWDPNNPQARPAILDTAAVTSADGEEAVPNSPVSDDAQHPAGGAAAAPGGGAYPATNATAAYAAYMQIAQQQQQQQQAAAAAAGGGGGQAYPVAGGANYTPNGAVYQNGAAAIQQQMQAAYYQQQMLLNQLQQQQVAQQQQAHALQYGATAAAAAPSSAAGYAYRPPPVYGAAAAAASGPGHKYPNAHYARSGAATATQQRGIQSYATAVMPPSAVAAAAAGGAPDRPLDADGLIASQQFGSRRSPFYIVESVLTRSVLVENNKLSLNLRLASSQVAKIRHAPKMAGRKTSPLAVHMRLFSSATIDHWPWDRAFTVFVNKHLIHIPELKKKSPWKLKGLDIVKPLDISSYVNENTVIEILYQRPGDYQGEMFRGIVYFELVKVKDTSDLMSVLIHNHKLEEERKRAPPPPPPPPPAPVQKKCGLCTITEDLLRCSRCKSEWYCTAEHQKEHWPVHRTVCVPHDEQKQPPPPPTGGGTAPAFTSLLQNKYHNNTTTANGVAVANNHAAAPAAASSSTAAGGGVKIEQKVEDEDDEVQTTEALLSLVCPLSIDRIKIAAKGRHCSHGRCFDLETFLALSGQGGNWQCPICFKALPFTEIVIDARMNDVLKQFGEDVTQVRMTSDGHFKAVAEKNDGESDSPKAKRHKSDAAPTAAAANASSASSSMAAAGANGGSAQTAAPAVRQEVALVDDDDDAAAAAAAAAGASSTAAAPAIAVAGGTQAATATTRATATNGNYHPLPAASGSVSASAAGGGRTTPTPAPAAAAPTAIASSSSGGGDDSDDSPPAPLSSHHHSTARAHQPHKSHNPLIRPRSALSATLPDTQPQPSDTQPPPRGSDREVITVDDDD